MLTITEAAARLGLETSWVRRLVTSGQLQARKVGPIWLVSEESVAAYQPRPQGKPGHRPKP
jgi:excisionase family DNA binding protein